MVVVAFVFAAPASAAALRFQERSLYMNSSQPGDNASYTISFRYMSPQPVGSVDMLFCVDPIPYHPCIVPEGLDVSGAVLTNQSGETNFAIAGQSVNRIVLSRAPAAVANPQSSYTFDNIINPVNTGQSFSIRLRSHSTTDATGPQIDFGSIKGQITSSIIIETQVPPMLIFCVAREVSENCTDTDDKFYTDMGELSAESTLVAQSQMAVGTNATGGFAVTANGRPMSAGTSIIEPLDEPSESKKGVNQFGINLVENSAPLVGADPEGDWANAVPATDYGVPNKYKYIPGDVIAYSPNVSLMKKFTVSYIVNSRDDLRAGVYSTTITYIASGRF